jgi:hypothetical protein
MKTNSPTPTHAHPEELAIHDAISDFPELSPAQYEALKIDIAENGIREPILVSSHNADGANGSLFIFDGRNRRRIAAELGLEKVPINVRDDCSPLDYALARALLGRQLTISGKVLFIAEHHPALTDGAKKRKGGAATHRKNQPVTKLQVDEEEASYVEIAERYQVPRQYFVALAKVKSMCRVPQEWDMVRKWVLEEERSWSNMTVLLIGWQATHPIGSDATPAPKKVPNNPNEGLIRSLIYLKGNFTHWEKLRPEVRVEAAKLWVELKKALPRELR